MTLAAADAPATKAKPFLKWAGGKSQLLEQFAALYPPRIGRLVEVFTGSAAVFFDLASRGAIDGALLLDNNAELIDCYLAVRDDVDALLPLLAAHRDAHAREHYYAVRAQAPRDLTPAERAARLIYLNKTCYNGLYRVNSRGAFNVPMGSYRGPRIFDETALRAAGVALRAARIERADFRETPDRVRPGDFVYLDPPYVPLSPTSSFTSYTAGAFGERDQRDLATVYRALDRAGCRLMLSNSDTSLVRELYAAYRIERVSARRAINSKGNARSPISELVVVNYSAQHNA